MNPTASNAFTASGAASFTVNCGIQIDSSSSSALSVSGSACVSGTAINIVGGDSATCANPTPKTDVDLEADPLAWLPAPAVGGCNYTNTKVNKGPAPTLNPGVYCGGITISGGNGAYVTSGTYILLGGGLTVSGGSWIQGASPATGVTFYNTSDASHTWKPITVSGGSNITLKAPATGTYEGILFFDRTVSTTQQTVSGGSGANIEGALYLPNTPLTLCASPCS